MLFRSDAVLDDDGIERFPIRYYHCGEYGEDFGRPHHHACLFNFDFSMKSEECPDGKYYWKDTRGGILYRCKALEDLWSDPDSHENYGFCSVGAVTFDSAAYVARYVLKKLNGEIAPGHYQGRQPEYTTMSRRPGIGKGFFDKYLESDIDLAFREGSITCNGRSYKIPKFYDAKFEISNPEIMEQVREERKLRAMASPDNTPERRRARETFHRARNEMRTRGYEK